MTYSAIQQLQLRFFYVEIKFNYLTWIKKMKGKCYNIFEVDEATIEKV